MAAIYWLGDADKTTAKVCIRADTAGTYDVTCNGVTQSVALDPGAASYGVGAVVFAGLAVDTIYAFEIRLAGALVKAGTLRTMPADDASFYIGFGSCWDLGSDAIAMYRLVQHYGIRAFFGLGDLPYIDGGDNTGRWNAANIGGAYSAPTDAARYNGMYLRFHRDVPAWAYLGERVPFYRMWDDHECVGNNFDHKLANVNATFTALGHATFANQAAVDAAFNVARTAFDVWTIGNPANTSPLALAAKPANADAATSVNNYPAQYFSKQLGSALIHVPDPRSHLGGYDDTDNALTIEWSSAAKTMLGLPQTKWLKSSLAASPYQFNPILMPVVTRPVMDSPDTDSWWSYGTEMAHWMRWITQRARGVVWGAGDIHTPFIINDEHHACVNACPINQAGQNGADSPNLSAGYPNGLAWKPYGDQAGGVETPRVVGLIHVTPDYLDWIILADWGQELTRWRQYPNANTLVKVF